MRHISLDVDATWFGEFGLAIAYSCVLIVIVSAAILLIQLAVGQRRLGRRGADAVSFQPAG